VKSINSEITDHAIVRYLERVIGVDIDELRKEIGGGRDVAHPFDGEWPMNYHGKKYRLIIEGGRVVTVTTGKQRRWRQGRKLHDPPAKK